MKRFKLSVTYNGFTISQKYLYPFLKAWHSITKIKSVYVFGKLAVSISEVNSTDQKINQYKIKRS
jgi:hypothetical protein